MIAALLKAFVVGGAICAVGQVLIDKTKLTPARILTGFVVTGVFLSAIGIYEPLVEFAGATGVLLSAIGIYEPLVEFAGAGATVPLTGFGHLLAQGAKKAVMEDGLLGILSGGMTAASAGITAALAFGLGASLVFRHRAKA